MPTKNFLFGVFCGLILLVASQGKAQKSVQQGTGCKLDTATYNQVPTKAKTTLMRGDLTGLPPQYSLRKYAPIARSQGAFGNCVGWAISYAARTIMLAQSLGWTSPLLINENALSPFFIYEKAKSSQDINCQEGTNLPTALEIIKELGTVKLKEFYETCGQNITSQHISKAKGYRIKEYKRLFEPQSTNKIELIKQSLAENKPVVAGIQCCTESFLNANGKEAWKLQTTDNPSPDGGHAVTVVAYDNNRNGGSVEIMNSWGTKWGNDGFIWINYEDFNKYCFEAYEMDIQTEESVLGGEVKLQLVGGEIIKTDLKNNGLHEARLLYSSGTMYQLQVSTQQPAYIYALTTDLSHKVQVLFPPNPQISAHISSPKSYIALPDEHHYLMLDNKVGTDYLCILYSSEKLNLDELAQKMENMQGSIYEKIQNILSIFLINSENILYENLDSIKFRAYASNKSRFVVPIIIAIPHKN